MKEIDLVKQQHNSVKNSDLIYWQKWNIIGMIMFSVNI